MKKLLILIPILLFSFYARSQTNRLLQKNTPDYDISNEQLEAQLKQLQEAGFLTSAPNLLVILMDFEDRPNNINADTVESFFNRRTLENNPESGGFKDYYSKNSYGKFQPQATIAGWYRAKHTYDYYRNELGINLAADSMYYEGLAAASVDPDIDLSIFDNDGDGEAEGIIVLTSAIIRAQARFYRPVTYAGIEFRNFAISTISQEDPNLGTTAHEYGHILGLPDLYLTDEPIGMYCIMSHAKGLIPGNFCAWSKYKLGWIEPTIVEEPISQIDIPSSVDNPFALMVYSDVYRDGRFFLVENRTSGGYDDKNINAARLPGEGLIIYHVDDSWDHEWVRVIQADGKEEMKTWNLSNGMEGNVGDEGDFFPGLTNNRTFNGSSTPNTNSFFGENYGVSIENISDPGKVMTADITPILEKGGTLRIQPDLINIFENSGSAVPPIGTTNDSIWGGDTYHSQGFDKIYGLTYYYNGRFTYPEDQFDAQKVNLKLYNSFDENTNTPVDPFYEGRFDVALPDIPESLYGLELFIRWRAMVWFDEPIEVPESFFAAYCPIRNAKDPLVGNQIYKGNILEGMAIPLDYGSYMAMGEDFPAFYKRTRNYLTLHFYASGEGTTSIKPLGQQEHILVYPNPATDQLFIQFEGGKELEVSIFNQLGQKLGRTYSLNSSQSIDISSLQVGIYYLHIREENSTSVIHKKIVIQE